MFFVPKKSLILKVMPDPKEVRVGNELVTKDLLLGFRIKRSFRNGSYYLIHDRRGEVIFGY